MDHASQRYLHTISLASCNAVDREIRRLIVAINRSLISSSSASDTVYTCSWFCLRPILHSAILTLRHFHRTRLAAFQLAELTLVNEPVRTGIAHAAGPNQNVVLGFDDRKGMIAAGGSHAWHRVKGFKGRAVVGVCWASSASVGCGRQGRKRPMYCAPVSSSGLYGRMGCRVSNGPSRQSARFGTHNGLGYYNCRLKLNGGRR